ncbi:MAG: sel1 repeat family protein [Elusimicrobiaceae bacterium]|nr:sel1 repeat family protein [Elusimicrobiaceae bacterium]
MKKWLVLSIFSIFLIGCSTTQRYSFQVSAQSVSPNKHHCRVYYTNKDEKTIDGKNYSAQLEDLLRSKGLQVTSNEEKTDCSILVAHSTEYGKEQQIGHTWGQTGVNSSTSWTNAHISSSGHGQASTYTTYTPTYGITGTYTYDVAKSYTTFSMSAKDSDTKDEMWNISVFYAGNVNEKFVNLFPIFKCIMGHFMFRNFDTYVELTKKDIENIYNGQCALVQWKDFKELEQMARKGDAEAQFVLSVWYLTGDGVVRDETKALYWVTKAAEQGHKRAQFSLGRVYERGISVPVDYQKAFFWYSKAADQQEPDGQNALANMYYTGKGIAQNLPKAFTLYSAAALQGNPSAEAKLACYDTNIKTMEEHFKRCLSMAEQGNVKAQYAVFDMYWNGYGIPQNRDVAQSWLKRAVSLDPKYEDTLYMVQNMAQTK